MFKPKKLFVIFVVIILVFILLKNFLVEQSDLTSFQSRLTVDHVAGRVEKVKEKITLYTKRNKLNKANLYQYFAEKRLAELAYVIQNDQINLVEETASRYSTYIGTLVNYVTANNIVDKKEELTKMFAEHRSIITNLQKKFEYDSAWWLVTQHNINTIEILIAKITNL